MEKELAKRLSVIMGNVYAINSAYTNRRVTFKLYQDRAEIIVYKSDISHGLLYDCTFKAIDKEPMYKELEEMEKVVKELMPKNGNGCKKTS